MREKFQKPNFFGRSRQSAVSMTMSIGGVDGGVGSVRIPFLLGKKCQ